jgi:hypothetical protein
MINSPFRHGAPAFYVRLACLPLEASSELSAILRFASMCLAQRSISLFRLTPNTRGVARPRVIFCLTFFDYLMPLKAA